MNFHKFNKEKTRNIFRVAVIKAVLKELKMSKIKLEKIINIGIICEGRMTLNYNCTLARQNPELNCKYLDSNVSMLNYICLYKKRSNN